MLPSQAVQGNLGWRELAGTHVCSHPWHGCSGLALGWLSDAAVTALLNRTRGENETKKLKGRDRDIAYQLTSRAKQTCLGEINLLAIKNRVGW